MNQQLYAGVARADISPPPGIPQGGWGAQTHQVSSATDMPLYATALVLKEQETEVAIVDVDLIGFDEQLVNALRTEISKESGIEASCIRLCATHSHSGPNYFRAALVTEGLDLLERYMGVLLRRIAEAVRRARANLYPVQVGFDTGSCPIAVNRRVEIQPRRVVVGQNPDGTVDHTVRVLRFNTTEGRTLATVVHYSCHPTVMAWENRYVTPDYPGPVRQEVERVLGGLCLFLQGAAGNIGPIHGFTGDATVYRRLGRRLGLEAASVAIGIEIPPCSRRLLGVLESGAPIALYEYQPREMDGTLAIRNRCIRMPLKKFPNPKQAEDEAVDFRKQLVAARAAGEPEKLRFATAMATQASMRAELARRFAGSTTLEWQLQAIRIGPCALVGVPGEPFVEIGMEVSRRSPFPMTLFSGYTNGGFGYLPVASAYPEGGYEVEVAPFSHEAADMVIRESLEVLAELSSD